MADLRYSVELDTQGASRSLNALKSQIASFGAAIGSAFAFTQFNQVSSRFEDLRTTLQLLYKDAQVGAAAFDDIKKFAESSIFSVESLTETVVKLKSAGLEPTVSLLRLFADTSSVAADSVGALQAITDLYARTTAGGLGLEDLNRLADRGIPVFTILSERLGLSRLEISKVGQTAEGAAVILKALEEGLQDAFGGATANRANNVSQAMSNFGDAVANLSDEIGQAGLNQGIGDLIRALTELIKGFTEIGKFIGSVLGPALSFLADNIKVVTFAAAGFLAVLTIGRLVAVGKAIFAVAKSFAFLNLVIGKGPIGLIARLAAAAGAAFGLVSDGVAELEAEFNKTNEAADALANSNGFKVLQDGNLGGGTDNLRERIQQLNQELNRFKAEMAAVVQDFARYNQETVKALNLETALIGVSRETQELRRAEAEITRAAASEIVKLEQAKARLNDEERRQGRGAIIDQTIQKIREQAEVDKKATAEAIAASEARQRARQVELFAIKSQIDLQEDLFKIQDDIAKMTMTEIEQKYYDIEAAARRSARAAIQAEEARIGRPLNAEEQRRYYEEATRGVERLKQATQTQFEQSRSFGVGWRRAFNEYVDAATNAAQRAENIFRRVTQGMEDLIVNFAKTGKLSFRDLASSIIEEILRAEIRLLASNIFKSISSGGGGGSGGLFGGAIIPGFLADGGAVSTKRPYIVGERGPELFIPEGAGRMIPNNQLGGGSVTYNINAVDASSFKALVAADPGFIHAVAQQGARSLPRR